MRGILGVWIFGGLVGIANIATGQCVWQKNGVPVCTAANGQIVPDLVESQFGIAIITWLDTRNPSTSFDIFAQRIGIHGTAQWITDGIPICNAPNPQLWPHITTDGLNGAIICWEDARVSNDSAYIYA